MPHRRVVEGWGLGFVLQDAFDDSKRPDAAFLVGSVWLEIVKMVLQELKQIIPVNWIDVRFFMHRTYRTPLRS